MKSVNESPLRKKRIKKGGAIKKANRVNNTGRDVNMIGLDDWYAARVASCWCYTELSASAQSGFCERSLLFDLGKLSSDCAFLDVPLGKLGYGVVCGCEGIRGGFRGERECVWTWKRSGEASVST